MKKIVISALGTLGFAILVTAGAIYSGLPDFSADTPHSPMTVKLIEWARERSIAKRAADIAPPADLDSAERIRRGAGNYGAMCADCHLTPGVQDSEIRQGLYPVPPNLATPSATNTSKDNDARRFWIIKHGVKGSGMPAWSKGGMDDESIWDLSAFLRVLPKLSPDDYREKVAASDGHSHRGADAHDHTTNEKSAESMPLAKKKAAHDHSTHKHSH